MREGIGHRESQELLRDGRLLAQGKQKQGWPSESILEENEEGGCIVTNGLA